MKTRIQFE